MPAFNFLEEFKNLSHLKLVWCRGKNKNLAKTEEQHKQNLVLIAAILAVGIVLAILFSRTPDSEQQEEATGPSPVYASQGQLAGGFPSELVLDGAASVESSYTIAYDASVNQHTAVFMSEISPASLYAQYKKYFTDNSWEIVYESDEGVHGLYARKAGVDINFTAGTQDEKTQVIIGYLVQ